ncbi:MAG: TlpA family protein disulfide reductase [Gammaproteobacteria bacterium]
MTGAPRFAAVALVLVLSAVLGRVAYDRQGTHKGVPLRELLSVDRGSSDAPSTAGDELGADELGAGDAPGDAGPVRPEFSLAGLDGKTYGPGAWAGKVLVLNFWATWCPPCREEIPDLMALQAAHGERGLQIVGIAIDDPKAAHEYATRLKVNYPNLVGAWDGQRVAEDYGNRIGALPFTVIVDRHGRIAYTKPGQIARDEAEAIVIPLLGAAGPT